MHCNNMTVQMTRVCKWCLQKPNFCDKAPRKLASDLPVSFYLLYPYYLFSNLTRF